MTKEKRVSHLAILTLVTVALAVPFASKAFYFDDGINIEIARRTGFNPFDTRGQYLYGGCEFSNLALNAHPIVIPYTLKVLMAFAGGAKEVPLHLGFIPFAILASISAYFLAQKFTGSPLLCTLLVITTPTFVISSHALMSDLPQLAFWLAATALGISGIDGGRRGRLILSGLTAAAAALTGYQTLAVIPLLLLYGVLLHGRSGLGRALIATSIPCVIFIVWSVGAYLTQGVVPLVLASKVGSYVPGTFPDPSLSINKNSVARLLSLLAYLGGVGIFGVVVIAALWAKKGSRLVLIFGGLFAMAFILIGPLRVSTLMVLRGYAPAQILFLWLCAAIGSAVMWDAGIGAVVRAVRLGRLMPRDKETLFLYVWIIGVAVYCCFILPFGAARYLLPLLPPAAMVMTRYFEAPFRNRAVLFKWVAGTSAACSLVLSVALALGDYEQAGVYRSFASSDRFAWWLAQARGKTYADLELGARFYVLLRPGVTYLAETRFEEETSRFVPNIRPRAGDQIVWCADSWSSRISRELESRLDPEMTDIYSVSMAHWPFRTCSLMSNTGFWTDSKGFLPFWFDRGEPLEIFYLMTVSPDADEDEPLYALE